MALLAWVRRTACFLLFTLSLVVGAQELPAPPKQPRRPTTRPFVAQELFASYWTLEPGWHTELEIRNNLGFRELTVTPSLRTFEGTEIALDPITINSDEVKTIDLADAVAKRAPNLLRAANSYGSVIFRYTSPDEANVFAASMVHSPGKPVSLHFDAEPRLGPTFNVGSFESIWWQPSPAADEYLILTNTSKKPIRTQVQFTSTNKVVLDQTVALGSYQTRRILMRELLKIGQQVGQFGGLSVHASSDANQLRIAHFAVDETTGSSVMLKVFERLPDNPVEDITLRAPMIALANPDPVLGLAENTKLTPYVILRNTSQKAFNITPVLNWKSATDTSSVKLSAVQLGGGESRPIDLATLQGNGTIPAQAQWGSLALSYKGADNDIIALSATTNERAEVIAQTPFTEAQSFLFKGSEWHADGTRSSLITVGNGGSEPTNASIVLFYNGGSDRYEFRQKLEPSEQAWLNIAQVIKNQIEDSKGRTIPPDVTKGSYEIRDMDHDAAGTLFEGKITIDKTYGHAAYGCTYYCCYWDPQLDPNSYTGNVGTGYQVTVWGNCIEDGWDYDITNLANTWTSSNTGVATFGGYIGWVDLVGAGSSTITAYANIESPYRVPYCKPTTRHGSGTANGRPTISSITPSRSLIGSSIQVTISGSGLNGSGLSISAGSGISVTINSSNASQIQATFAISSGASSGNHSVTVTTGGQTTSGTNFYVQTPAGSRIVSTLASNSATCPAGQAGWYRRVSKIVTDQSGSDITNDPQSLAEVVTLSATNQLQIGSVTTSAASTSGNGYFQDQLQVCSPVCPGSSGYTDATQVITDVPSGTSTQYQLSPNAFRYTCTGNYINGQ